MKNVILAITTSLLSVSALAQPSNTKFLQERIGRNLCKINGAPIAFKRTNSFGSVINGVAQIDTDAVMTYQFNPFYGIGFQVALRTINHESVLLRLYNDFANPIYQSSIVYKDYLIECKIP